MAIVGIVVGALCVATAIGDEGKAAAKPERPLVQIALLLDTSNSMDGMINQAKAQLWSIVNEFATAKRSGAKPILQVALYQYGTPSLGLESGYIKQLAPLTDDLDSISKLLFELKTNGGDEYCGWVIKTATEDLKWSANKSDYMAIFIAGNEPFSQGKVKYEDACKAAATKGIIVNTIHCAGAEDTGWAEGARLADGRFMRIDGNQAVVQIKAPQDEELARLNADLNKTYVAYGARGKEYSARQASVDANAQTIGSANVATRAAAKASAQYRNTEWDLVDAVREDKVAVEKMDAAELPDELKKLSAEERKQFVEKKQKERETVQTKIKELSDARTKYVADEMKKTAAPGANTLGDSIRAAVREQATQKAFKFE
ncbi:MAG: hypothetical protein C0404_09640 [Verrucomicrobia bacterium]|nr:hypothetical protein [Verrucomicrobiota bacterium]